MPGAHPIDLRLAVLLAVALWGPLACGSPASEEPAPAPPQALTAAERAHARSGEEAIRAYCRRLARRIARGGAPPGPVAQRRAVEGARRIAALARRKPEAAFSTIQTARDLAGDLAEDLEGTNCSARLVAELARGL